MSIGSDFEPLTLTTLVVICELDAINKGARRKSTLADLKGNITTKAGSNTKIKLRTLPIIRYLQGRRRRMERLPYLRSLVKDARTGAFQIGADKKFDCLILRQVSRSDTVGGTVLALTEGPESDTENLCSNPLNQTISEVSSDALDSEPDHLDLRHQPSQAHNASQLARVASSTKSILQQNVLNGLKLQSGSNQTEILNTIEACAADSPFNNGSGDSKK